ncbi:flagellar export protein FliJ [Cellulomonas cellasea]|uniref:Flagellar FliJ protein n=1 Tax=Cellulomonas cellasea TaxID=43670 RepID=A0A4Y3L369_9CELL|nr:flagellar FliJ family protein [Cellulomonas cellasea]GEA90146.1 hypothetical protein CCE01nite_40950 [Cellulomonas cellasea]
MSRTFRLASLLRLRSAAEERAAVELADAARLRARAEARRHDTEVQLGSAAMPAHSDELHFRAAVAARVSLSGLLAERTVEVRVADDGVDQAHAVWASAKARARALEKLEEKHDAEVRAEDERAEQLVLDEVAGQAARRAALRAGTPEVTR